VFFDAAAFARASSHIALPMNLAAAASPPLLVAVLTNFGTNAVLGVSLVCSLIALALLLALVRLQRKVAVVRD
jgi:hypothetical protein